MRRESNGHECPSPFKYTQKSLKFSFTAPCSIVQYTAVITKLSEKAISNTNTETFHS